MLPRVHYLLPTRPQPTAPAFRVVTRQQHRTTRINKLDSVGNAPVLQEIIVGVGFILAVFADFERAIEIDPDGLIGKLAQRALDSVATPA